MEQQKQVLQLAEKMVKEIQEGKSLQSVALLHQQKVQELGFVRRDNVKIDRALLDAIFSVPMDPKKPSNQVTLLPRDSGDYVLVMVQGRKTDASAAAVAENEVQKQLENNVGQLEYALYTKTAASKANIEYKEHE